jgi:hypothetical protein
MPASRGSFVDVLWVKVLSKMAKGEKQRTGNKMQEAKK